VVAGAVTTAYALKEQVVLQVRDERRREPAFYVTRDELAVMRERDRNRLDAKLGDLVHPGSSASRASPRRPLTRTEVLPKQARAVLQWLRTLGAPRGSSFLTLDI